MAQIEYGKFTTHSIIPLIHLNESTAEKSPM